MIVLDSVGKEVASLVEIDKYVPFSIEFSHAWPRNDLVYWRVLDSENSLLEMALDAKSGSLRNLCLVNVNPPNVQKKRGPRIDSQIRAEKGCPVFKISGLEPENGPFDSKSEKGLKLILGDRWLELNIYPITVERILINGSVILGFSSVGELVKVNIEGLDLKQIHTLEHHL